MARINKHHITYDPEWIVELWARWHREITFISNTKATPEFRDYLHNFMISIQHQYTRVCFQLFEINERNVNGPANNREGDSRAKDKNTGAGKHGKETAKNP